MSHFYTRFCVTLGCEPVDMLGLVYLQQTQHDSPAYSLNFLQSILIPFFPSDPLYFALSFVIVRTVLWNTLWQLINIQFNCMFMTQDAIVFCSKYISVWNLSARAFRICSVRKIKNKYIASSQWIKYLISQLLCACLSACLLH